MSATFEDLRILQLAEEVADTIWKRASQWDSFSRDVVGAQLARAADSIGANIAEAFGRFHFGEKLQFLYYARGSLFETKYWLNRARSRELMTLDESHDLVAQLTTLARQLNAFATSLRTVRSNPHGESRAMRESSGEYMLDDADDHSSNLLEPSDFAWLES